MPPFLAEMLDLEKKMKTFKIELWSALLIQSSVKSKSFYKISFLKVALKYYQQPMKFLIVFLASQDAQEVM